jgi:hypothetical protein
MRPTDYHMVTVTTSSGSNVRSASVVFHELSSQSLLLPAPLPAPSIESQPAPYLRLRATIGAIQGIYSDSLSLRYTDGSKTMSVSQSMGFGGNTNAVASMPDLSGVSGWSNTYAIAAGSTGTWTFATDGSTGGSRCTANWQSVRQTLSGSF